MLLNLSNVHPMYGRITLKQTVYNLERRVLSMCINVYILYKGTNKNIDIILKRTMTVATMMIMMVMMIEQ